MEDNNIREIKKNIDILLGSVETHECDPLQDCEECDGSGDCHVCDGDGQVDCKDCHGSGDCHHCHGHGKDTCQSCHGQGHTRCNHCGGSGTCRKCGGSGQVRCKNCGGSGTVYVNGKTWNCYKCEGTGYRKCPDCSGMFSGASGNCQKCKGTGELECKKCDGTGEITCKHCDGSGKCTKCSGTGKLTCEHCEGSGKCPECTGTGKVTCKRCQGSGWYQTFLKSETTLYAKDWTYVSKNPINDAIEKSVGPIIYAGYYMMWKSATQVDFDKTEEVRNVCKEYLGKSADKVDEYVSEYETKRDLRSPARGNDKPYAKHLTAEAIPVTKIEYTTNGQDYILFISGDNHVVSYDSVPTQIQAYEQSFFERIKLALSEKKRMKQFAMLAAYIFQCDGRSKEESKMLNLLLNELNLSGSSKEKFLEKLDSFNSSMPYTELRNHIKGLFATKKTLSFAWQCMAVDKQISGEEENLYKQLCSEYQLSENEAETLKGYARRFAKIKDENIVSEYCDKTNKSKNLRVLTYSIIGALIVAVLAIGGGVVYSLTKPEQKVEVRTEPLTPQSSKSESDVEKDAEEILSDVEADVEEASADITDFNAPTLISIGVALYAERSSKESYFSDGGFKKAGSDDDAEYWTKNCTYSVDEYEIKESKPSSYMYKLSKNSKDVTITVFDKGLYNELKKTLGVVGYKKSDEYKASSGNYFEIYTNNSSKYPKITASDESNDSDLPYNIHIGDSE